MIPPAAPPRKMILESDTPYAVEWDVVRLVRGFVGALRPQLIVETGAGEGTVTRAVWRELRRVEFGHLVSVESDPEYAAELAGDSSFDVREGILGVDYIPELPIELAFLDSEYDVRVRELELVWDFVRPGGIVLVHDASRRMKRLWGPILNRSDVRVVFLPTQRGLAVCERL